VHRHLLGALDPVLGIPALTLWVLASQGMQQRNR